MTETVVAAHSGLGAETMPGAVTAVRVSAGNGVEGTGLKTARHYLPATAVCRQLIRRAVSPFKRRHGITGPSSVYRGAFEYEPPGLPRSRRTQGIRASWNGLTRTELSDLPMTMSRHADGQVLQPSGWSQLPAHACSLGA